MVGPFWHFSAARQGCNSSNNTSSGLLAQVGFRAWDWVPAVHKQQEPHQNSGNSELVAKPPEPLGLFESCGRESIKPRDLSRRPRWETRDSHGRSSGVDASQGSPLYMAITSWALLSEAVKAGGSQRRDVRRFAPTSFDTSKDSKMAHRTLKSLEAF